MDDPTPPSKEQDRIPISSGRLLMWVLAFIAAVSLYVYSLLYKQGQLDDEEYFDPDAGPVVLLDTSLVLEDGRRVPTEEVLPVTGKLAFEARISKRGALALMVREGDEAPRVLAQYTNLRPGPRQWLQQDGELLVYPFTKGGAGLRLCLIAANDPETLQQRIGVAGQLWNDLIPGACSRFVTSPTAGELLPAPR